MKYVLCMTLGAAFAFVTVTANAGTPSGHAATPTTGATAAAADHIMVTAKDIVWKDGPGSLAPGAKFAVIEGDPSKEGPFTMRLKVPAKFKIMPHSHPGVEHVTGIDGVFAMGKGGTWDDKALKEFSAGDFVVMQPGTQHFYLCKKDCTVQLHGIGPWAINYVNPADDPRTAAKK